MRRLKRGLKSEVVKMEIYTGKPVKTTKDNNIYEILRVDDYTESVFCTQLGTYDVKIVEFKISELKEL